MHKHSDRYLSAGSYHQNIMARNIIWVCSHHVKYCDLWVCPKMGYPLVNVYITIEHHHCSWENPLFLWPFSIAMLVYQRVYSINCSDYSLNHYKIPLNPYKIPLNPYKIPLNPYKIPLNPYKIPLNPYKIPFQYISLT